MNDDVCGLAGCQRPSVLTFYRVPLCQAHWERYCERWETMKAPLLRRGYKWPAAPARKDRT